MFPTKTTTTTIKRIFSSLHIFPWDILANAFVAQLLVSLQQPSSKTWFKFHYLYSPPNLGLGSEERLRGREGEAPFPNPSRSCFVPLPPLPTTAPSAKAPQEWSTGWLPRRQLPRAECWAGGAGAAPSSGRAYEELSGRRVLIPAPASTEWALAVAVGFGFASLRRR